VYRSTLNLGKQRIKQQTVGGYCTYEAAVLDVPRYYQHLKDGSLTSSFNPIKGAHVLPLLISPAQVPLAFIDRDPPGWLTIIKDSAKHCNC